MMEVILWKLVKVVIIVGDIYFGWFFWKKLMCRCIDLLLYKDYEWWFWFVFKFR